MQDKLHYAITGLTASEIIATRCNPKDNNLGLTNWKGTKVRKGDVITAKTISPKTNCGDLISS
nr:RhuM family protein [Corynebacterium sp. sy039]